MARVFEKIFGRTLAKRKKTAKKIKKEVLLVDEDLTGIKAMREKYQDLVNSDPDNLDALKKLIEISEKLGEKEKVKEFYDRLDKIESEKEFERNLKSNIKLQRLEINDLYFFDHFKWMCQPQMNILLGRNGYGKSYLLRLLAALLQKDDEKTAEFFKYSKGDTGIRLALERDDEPLLISRNQLLFEESPGKIPVLALPDLRAVDKSRITVGTVYEESSDLKRNGAHHFLYQKPLDGIIQNFLYQLCITYLDKGKSFDLPIFNLIHTVIGELADQEFKFHKIAPIGNARFQIEVITEGNDKPIPLQQASQGTLSILAIFGLIYDYLQSIFSEIPEKRLLKQPAIVIIDELDAHLHPAWQQKIVRLLRENFPNIQFFVTAHSPLVVAGCKEGEAAVMRKEKKGFVVQVFDQDFIGYEASELYEKVFEIEEADETYLHYHALYPFKKEIEAKIKSLKGKKRRSQEEEEQLTRLYDDIYYLERANDRYQKHRENISLLEENKRLKRKIRRIDDTLQ